MDDAYWQRLIQIESGGDPNANMNNPNTQYKGIAQLGNSERSQWGVTDPTNVDQQKAAVSHIYDQNSAQFSKALGRDPEHWESYMMHQQGPTGTLDMINNPNALAADTVGKYGGNGVRKIAGNYPGGLSDDDAAKLTNQQFLNTWKNKFNGVPSGQPAGLLTAGNAAPQMTGAAAPQMTAAPPITLSPDVSKLLGSLGSNSSTPGLSTAQQLMATGQNQQAANSEAQKITQASEQGAMDALQKAKSQYRKLPISLPKLIGQA